MNQERRQILLVVDDTLLAEITDFRLTLLGYDVESVQTASRRLPTWSG